MSVDRCPDSSHSSEILSSSVLLRSALLPEGTTADVSLSGGVITAIGRDLVPEPGAEVIDLTGHVLSVSFSEPHAHLDKAFLADRIHNPTGDLMGAIEGLHAVRASITHADTVERAIRAVDRLSRSGVTSIRSHADTTLANGLQSVEALLEVKRRCSAYMDLQIAMLLEWPLTGQESSARRALASDAIAAGVDVVGGCPHLDPNPQEAVEYLLGLALEHRLPLDLHADENLRPTSTDLEHLADIMIADGVTHPVNASHCVSLSVMSPVEMDRVADKVAAAGITVTALPQTNLFLQSRDIRTAPPRAITPIAALRRAGVTVAAGSDNIQDPFNPMGRLDPLEIASLMVTAAHVPVADALDLVTSHAHAVVTGSTRSLAVGQRADLVAIPATTIRESMATAPEHRLVLFGGDVVTDESRNRK